MSSAPNVPEEYGLPHESKFQCPDVNVNFKSEAPEDFGYCVFGRVYDGIEIVDLIKAVETTYKGGHSDVPLEEVIIEKATIV